MIYRLALVRTRTKENAEDVYQEVFLRLSKKMPEFESEEHEKAWLVVTASNICKSLLRRKHRTEVSIDAVPQYLGAYDNAPSELLQIILTMPEKYKLVIYLYYYEGYSQRQIAEILHISRSAVQTRMDRARQQLRKELSEDA